MARKMVSFRLPEDVLEMLRELADMWECSQADVLNTLIRMQFAKENRKYIGDFADIVKMVK